MSLVKVQAYFGSDTLTIDQAAESTDEFIQDDYCEAEIDVDVQLPHRKTDGD